MLILTRKSGESVMINGNIQVEVLGIKNDGVRLGVSAPVDILIDRQEVHERRKENFGLDEYQF
jgi:carbon storage regulator